SGFKLLSTLAGSGKQEWRIEDMPAAGVHTNIVAGVIVGDDGRTVVARLPRAEVEAAQQWQGLLAQQPGLRLGDSDFTLVRGDGKHIKAKFVGLDAATGLSLLEAVEPLLVLTPAPRAVPAPAVGQRVRLYAPTPAAPASPASPAAAPNAPDHTLAGDEGDTEVIYLGIGETEGYLTEVKRAPSGVPVRARVNAPRITSAWTGAIATNESGEVVGILLDSGETDPEIVPAETVRVAAERVLTRRASVPQPWLGAGGSAVSNFSLSDFTLKGWTFEMAAPIIHKKQGVVLTSVVPGAPAAAAGLQPGDVILRVGGRDVRGVDDFTFWIKEAGAGATLNFTVWRSTLATPLDVPVQLSAAQNPALAGFEATMQDALRKAQLESASARQAGAELRAVQERVQSLQNDLRSVRLAERQLMREAHAADFAARLEGLRERLKGIEASFAAESTALASAEARYAAALHRAALAGQDATPRPLNAAQPLLSFGLKSMSLTTRLAPKFKVRGGLLVVSVRGGSPAAAAGLMPGDVVETINGRPVSTARDASALTRTGTPDLTLGIVRSGRRMTVALLNEEKP
ncbi:MAG TPA: PDZ domain-containing protein, partial [Pyrinomonadaceae bacterium]|nr:PDZ domain-containing protein [Pyrinomonadaceae bacterium]